MFQAIRFTFFHCFLVLLISSSSVSGQVRDQDADRSKSQPPSTPQAATKQRIIEVVIPSKDGAIRWSDVAKSIGSALQLDPQSISQMLPAGQLDVHSDAVLLVLLGINLASGDAISFDLIRDDQNRGSLRVQLDRNLLGTLPETTKQQTRIDIDQDWRSRSFRKPIVVFLHGLKSDAVAFDSFRKFVRKSGYATAGVSYDYELPIAQTAQRLSTLADETFSDDSGKPKLVLVGHSMGGLVAREWTENHDLNDKRIIRLVTLGTPHSGSNWASLPPLLDLFTGKDFDVSDLIDVILHQPSAAGLRDLVPESEFLNELNSRPRRSDVAYTTIVGLGSPVDDEQVAELRRVLRSVDQDGSVVRLIRPRIRPLMESFDELSRGKGDGVVAASHATIPGVDDSVEVDLSHFDMVGPISQSEPNPVWTIVLDRLGS